MLYISTKALRGKKTKRLKGFTFRAFIGRFLLLLLLLLLLSFK